jgi:hypothetical protein
VISDPLHLRPTVIAVQTVLDDVCVETDDGDTVEDGPAL